MHLRSRHREHCVDVVMRRLGHHVGGIADVRIADPRCSTPRVRALQRSSQPAAERPQRAEQRIGCLDIALVDQALGIEHLEEGPDLVAPRAAAIDQLGDRQVPVRHVVQHAPVGDPIERGTQLRPGNESIFFHSSNGVFRVATVRGRHFVVGGYDDIRCRSTRTPRAGISPVDAGPAGKPAGGCKGGATWPPSSSGRIAQRLRHLALPRQGMHQLVQVQRHLRLGERIAVRVDEAQVGDHAERVGHGHDALAELDPIPGDARSVLLGVVAPEGLTGARAGVVAKTRNSGAEMDKMQSGRRTGLPQYGSPCVDDPCGCHGALHWRCFDGRTSVYV